MHSLSMTIFGSGGVGVDKSDILSSVVNNFSYYHYYKRTDTQPLSKIYSYGTKHKHYELITKVAGAVVNNEWNNLNANGSYTSSRALPPLRATAGHLLVMSVLGVGLELIQRHPEAPLKNLSTFLKVCFLNFNMYFNLKSHNFKANNESVYKIVAFCNRPHSIHSIRYYYKNASFMEIFKYL